VFEEGGKASPVEEVPGLLFNTVSFPNLKPKLAPPVHNPHLRYWSPGGALFTQVIDLRRADVVW
jgi:hypothetical protein